MPIESTHIYKPGHFVRQFIYIPLSVSSASVRIQNLDKKRSENFSLHLLQINSQKLQTSYKQFNLLPQESDTFSVKLISGQTLEVCSGMYWTSSEEIHIKLIIEFFGLK